MQGGRGALLLVVVHNIHQPSLVFLVLLVPQEMKGMPPNVIAAMGKTMREPVRALPPPAIACMVASLP